MSKLDKLKREIEVSEVDENFIGFIKKTGKNKNIFVFEGIDDIFFYKILFKKINPDLEFTPHEAKGKENVFKLFESVEKSSNINDKIFYFIDHDLDGLRYPYVFKDNFFVTDGYSIESYLASSEVLSVYLNTQCILSDDEVEFIQSIYEIKEAEFYESISKVTRAMYYAKCNGENLRSKQDKLVKFIKLDFDGRIEYRCDDIKAQLGWPDGFDINYAYSNSGCWRKYCRGKYKFDFFKKFIEFVYNNRKSYIGDGSEMISVSENVIHTLTGWIDIPESLSDFYINSIQ